MKKLFTLIAGLLAMTTLAFGQSTNPVSGRYPAVNYSQWAMELHDDVAAGSNAVQVVPVGRHADTAQNNSCLVGYINGIRQATPFSVGERINVVDGSGSGSESALALTGVSVSNGICTITATFANAHKAGTLIRSGTGGLDEAINDLQLANGGMVSVGPEWTTAGGTTALLSAALVYASVSIEDVRSGAPQFWTPSQSVATVLAAPTTLTATTVGFGLNGANTTGGFYVGANTYHYCIAYVDVMGNEGPCSADFSAATAGSGSTNQIGFSAPAASTGAVGYTIYISLTGGTYNLSYQAPITSTVCTMTHLESVTPACAVANTSYGQTGSAAAVSALTVNTAPLHLLASAASTTSAYIGSPSGRTVYIYAPHQNVGAPGFTVTQQAYAIAPATATTVPAVLGTIPIPIGSQNIVGRTIEVCGEATEAANGSTATIENIQFLWDAAGSNTAGAPVIIGALTSKVTLITATIAYISFCGDFQTTVSGSGVTAGTLAQAGGYIVAGSGAAGAQATGAGLDETAAAVGSLNLAGTGGNTQRIHVVYQHTTGTDAAGFTLLGLTAKVI